LFKDFTLRASLVLPSSTLSRIINAYDDFSGRLLILVPMARPANRGLGKTAVRVVLRDIGLNWHHSFS
jgi:hypothetical protein